MIKRILVNGLLTSVLQIIIYILILYVGWTMGKIIHEPQKMTVVEVLDFGVIVQMSIILFGTMLLLTNLLTAIINKRPWTWGLLGVLSLLYIIGWGEDFNYWPWKTTLFLLAGLTAIFLKVTIDKRINSGFKTNV